MGSRYFADMTASKVAYLLTQGMTIGLRDPRINRAFSGAFMIHGPDISIPCDDASQAGTFAIVGDDLGQLIHDAFEWAAPTNSQFDSALVNHAREVELNRQRNRATLD